MKNEAMWKWARVRAKGKRHYVARVALGGGGLAAAASTMALIGGLTRASGLIPTPHAIDAIVLISIVSTLAAGLAAHIIWRAREREYLGSVHRLRRRAKEI